MNLNQYICAFREAGRVRRAHTRTIQGEYNVAIHSWNAVNLLLTLWPKEQPPRLELVLALMWHDVPERWTGDIPAPAKWARPELKTALQFAEWAILKRLEIDTLFDELDEEETKWLRGVDILELFIWAQEQVTSGNKPMEDMQFRILGHVHQNKEKYPKEIIKMLDSFEVESVPELDKLEEEHDSK